jgi:starch synthase (maltosyl-transferring)
MIRRENPALQRFPNVTLLETESEHLFAFAKRRDENSVVVVVNLDAHAEREGVAILPAALGFPPAFTAKELLADQTFTWNTGRNFVRLGPGQAHILRVG